MKKECARRIISRLAELGMSQADLSRRTGIHKATLSQYTTGRYLPSQDKLYLLAKALHTNEAWLMGYDIPNAPTDEGSPAHMTLCDLLKSMDQDDLKNIEEYIRFLQAKRKGSL